MKRKRIEYSVWVLKTHSFSRKNSFEYLYSTRNGYGDDGWGPSYLSTPDITQAVKFESKQAALASEAKRGWTEAEPVEVQIKTVMSYE